MADPGDIIMLDRYRVPIIIIIMMGMIMFLMVIAIAGMGAVIGGPGL